MSTQTTDKVSVRFWSKVRRGDGCWTWTAGKSWGYGTFHLNNRTVRAHRVAWMLTHGPISRKDILCHRCDNPACVRPDHLFVGTQRDNLLDASAKGRLSGRRNYWRDRTHCKNGHEYTPENTYRSKGRRYCLRCREQIANRQRQAALGEVR